MRIFYIMVMCLLGATTVQAQNYVEPTLDGVIDLLYVDGLIDLSQNDQARDYLRVKDCEALKQADADEFKWQAIKKAVQDKVDTQTFDVLRQFKIPANIKIDNYNFVTSSFDIHTDSQLKAVRFLQFYSVRDLACRIQSDRNYGFITFEGLPQDLQIELEAPFSMLRVPVGQALGQRILKELEKDEEGKRVIYLTTYVTLDTMDRVIQSGVGSVRGKIAVGVGRIDRIDFFVDQARTRRFKTLYPSLD